MRYFDIYLMEEEITRLYLGKEDLLFRLFLEERHETEPERRCMLGRQINFITKPIAYTILRRYLKSQHIIETTEGRWLISHENGMATLSFAGRFLTLESSGNISAETSFFEVLRHVFPNFFAIDYFNNRGAWLTPHRKPVLFHRQLVL